MLRIIVISLGISLLTGCATGPPAHQFYQSCSNYLEELDDVLSCGKKTRNDQCLSNNSCSTYGNKLVLFFDKLQHELESGERTDLDARLIFQNQIQHLNTLANKNRLKYYWAADVSAFSSSVGKAKKTYILLPEKSSDSDDLQFEEFKTYINRSLISKGFSQAKTATDADIAIMVQYSVGDAFQKSFTMYEPIEGVTGVSSSTTKARIDRWGNIDATTKNTPSYGVIGESAKTFTTTRYLSQLKLTALDAKTLARDRKRKTLWAVSSQIDNRESDMRRLFPALLAAAQPHIGKSTGQVIKQRIYHHSLPIQRVKGIITP